MFDISGTSPYFHLQWQMLETLYIMTKEALNCIIKYLKYEIFSAIGWITIPAPVEIPFGLMTFKSWNLFLLCTSIPSAVAFLLLMYLPESPRFLLLDGQIHEAQFVLRKMFRMNHKKGSVHYPVSMNENQSYSNYGPCHGILQIILEF
jgi:hypothetical protein